MVDSGDGLVWTFEFEVPPGSDGEATVSISGVTDEAGNPNLEPENNTFTIDSAGPAVELTYEPQDDIQPGGVVTITATFDEPPSGIPSIVIDTTTVDMEATSMSGSGGGLIWTFTYTVPEGAEGEATVSIIAVDEAGNSNQDAANNVFEITSPLPKVIVTYGNQGEIKPEEILVITATIDPPAETPLTIIIDTPGVDLEPSEMTGGGTEWTFDYEVPGESDGTATVTVVVTTEDGGDTSLDPANNTFIIGPIGADLSVAISGSPEPVSRGSALTYSITVENAGPSSAAGVVLTSPLDPAVIFVAGSADSPDCEEADGTVTCLFGELAAGASAAVAFDVTVDSAAEGTLFTRALVSSDVTDDSIDNNEAVERTTVMLGQLTYSVTADAGDLDATGITLADFPDPVFVNEELAYTLEVTNSGSGEISGVELTVTLPPAVIFESATATLPAPGDTSGTTAGVMRIEPQGLAGRPLADPAHARRRQIGAGRPTTYSPVNALNLVVRNQSSCNESTGTIVCNLGSLATDQSATVVITVETVEAGILNNDAEVTADNTDPDATGARASESTTVLRAADLSLTKVATPPGSAGIDQIGYALNVTNNGPSQATEVIVTDVLSPGVSLVSAIGERASCVETRGLITCSLGTLAAGESANLNIVVSPSTEGEIPMPPSLPPSRRTGTPATITPPRRWDSDSP